MDGLVYLVVVWPIAGLAAVVVGCLGIIALVKLLRRRRAGGGAGQTFGHVCLGVGLGSIVLVACTTFGAESYFNGLQRVDVALVHVLVFGVLATPTIVLGVLLRKPGGRPARTGLRR